MTILNCSTNNNNNDNNDDAHHIEGAWGTVAEQQDESHFDSRSDAEDDMQKGRIKFPKDKLYGRDRELERLKDIYEEVELNALKEHGGLCSEFSSSRRRLPRSPPRSPLRTPPRSPARSPARSPLRSPGLDEANSQGDRISGSSACSDVSIEHEETLLSSRPSSAASSRVVFLSGYSGVGKSALVAEFARQIKDDDLRDPLLFANGKFSERKTSVAPFSAISVAFQRAFQSLLELRGCSALLGKVGSLPNLRKKATVNVNNSMRKDLVWSVKVPDTICCGSKGRLFVENSFPAIAALLSAIENLDNQDSCREDNAGHCGDHRSDHHGDSSSPRRKSSSTFSITIVKETFREFMLMMCNATKQPLILFLDDMQWADTSSLELLSFLVSDCHAGRNVMFIFAFRVNEVRAGHPFHDFMENIYHKRESGTTTHTSVDKIDLFGLSPEIISLFIADILDQDVEQVMPLADVVNKLTMGNIFHVMQAMEQLVLKNALYYDMMSFQWKWNVSRVDLESYLNDDVVDLIKYRIKLLPKEAQTLLSAMAYIPRPLDKPTLQAVLWSEGIVMHAVKANKLLKHTTAEGLLIYDSENDEYDIFHDQVRKACYSLVPEGVQRYQLLIRISQVLLSRRGSSPNNEWMMYVAVDLFNTVPHRFIDRLFLAKLNLLVGKTARCEGAYAKAKELLLAGLKCLESCGNKWNEYEIALDISNYLIMSEYSLGNYDCVKLMIQDVIQNTKSTQDKFTAYLHQIFCATEERGYKNYKAGLKEGIKVLKIYAIEISCAPTIANQLQGELYFRAELQLRSLSFLLHLPMATDDSLFQLLALTSMYALHTDNNMMLRKIIQSTLHLSTQNGISRFTPEILTHVGVSLINKGHIATGHDLGNIADSIIRIFHDDKEQFHYLKFKVYAGILAHFIDLTDVCDVLRSSMLGLKMAGQLERALVCASSYFAAYFAAGLPLNSVLESRLLLMEEYSRSTNEATFAEAIRVMRQFVLRLRKLSHNPTKLRVESLDFGLSRDQFFATSGSNIIQEMCCYGLQLAVIYGDFDCMDEMLGYLAKDLMADFAIARSYNLRCYAGLAAASLKNRNNRSYVKFGKSCLDYFAHFKKYGGVNAYPIYCLIDALKNPSKSSFEKAISSCAESKRVHLEAIAHEQYGLFLIADKKESIGHRYIKNAYGCYRSWGADGKANFMLKTFSFLKKSKKGREIER